MAKILVVDDEAPLRTVVCRFLERIGHEVVPATNGLEGVEAYGAGDFDIVLMDVVMPVMGGLEAIGRIISDDPDARIIALSAGWTESAVNPLMIATDLGATRTVEKPYELNQLQVVLDEVLGAA